VITEAAVPVREDEIGAYSDTNLEFHQQIVELAHSELFSADRAEELVRQHAISLAGHVRDNVTYLR
jgi:DNA-binding GntR family transcriptional regulator